jgi:hypothetical protein
MRTIDSIQVDFSVEIADFALLKCAKEGWSRPYKAPQPNPL